MSHCILLGLCQNKNRPFLDNIYIFFVMPLRSFRILLPAEYFLREWVRPASWHRWRRRRWPGRPGGLEDPSPCHGSPRHRNPGNTGGDGCHVTWQDWRTGIVLVVPCFWRAGRSHRLTGSAAWRPESTRRQATWPSGIPAGVTELWTLVSPWRFASINGEILDKLLELRSEEAVRKKVWSQGGGG